MRKYCIIPEIVR